MNKNRIFVLILFFIFLIPYSVKADFTWNSGKTNGVGGYVSGCGGDKYCYSMVGLRASLYKITETNKTEKVGRSHDYWKTQDSDGTNQNYPTNSHVGSNSKFSSLYNDDINDKITNKIPTKSRFSISASDYLKYNGEKVTYLGLSDWKYSYLELNESKEFIDWIKDTKNNAIFKTLNEYENLKKNLGLNDDQIDDVKYNQEKYYIVLETIFGIWIGNNISNENIPSEFSGTDKEIYYVGTLFELNAFSNYFGGMNIYFKNVFVTGKVGNFVGSSSSNILKYLNGNESVNQSFIKTNNAIGLNVYKLSDIVVEKTCKSVCGKYPSLACAENYCESVSKNSTQKKQCLTETSQCGLSRPTQSCSSNTTTSPTSSVCESEQSSKKSTCVKESDYYMSKCEEQTTIKYNDSLPVYLNSKVGGFNYSLSQSGVRKCTITFNKTGWEFDYAATKRNDTNAISTLKTVLDNYNKLSQNNYEYKYESTDGAELKVKSLTYNLNAKNKSTTTSNNLCTKEMFSQYKNGSKLNYSNNCVKYTITSKSSVEYELPLQCYSLKTGKITDCSSSITGDRNLAYFGYYSEHSKSDVGIFNEGNYKNISNAITTTVTTTKTDSGLNDTNSCFFQVGDENEELGCEIIINTKPNSDGSYSGTTFSATMNVINRYNTSGIQAKFNGLDFTTSSFTINNFDLPTSGNSQDVYGSVSHNGTTFTCKATITNKARTGDRCVDKFKSSQYDAIKNYCKSNWQTDLDNYTSYNDCYKSCSSNGRTSCKTKYNCNQTDQIKSYCNANYKNDGYKNVMSCVNDCTCTEVKDEIEYYYRPISYSNPFPGLNESDTRNPGSNWVGYKSIIDSSAAASGLTKAKYVIQLNSSIIKSIRNDSTYKSLNSAVSYNGTYNKGLYSSGFIKKYNNIFLCINGTGVNGGSCDR